MKEIEIKLKYSDRGKVQKALSEFGACFREKIQISDSYYGVDGKTMEESKSIIRIRQKSGEQPEITYKGDLVENNGIWERTEINLQVESAETAKEILDRLPINHIYVNETIREYWEKDSLEIVFMDFLRPKNLELIEVEGTEEAEILNLVEYLGDKVEPVGAEAFKHFA